MKRNGLAGSIFTVGSPDWITHFCDGPWEVSAQGNLWKNILKHNVAIIRDHNDPDQWRFRIEDPRGNQSWSHSKYSSAEEAKRPAIKELARRLSLTRV
jgi:hypothetical protein